MLLAEGLWSVNTGVIRSESGKNQANGAGHSGLSPWRCPSAGGSEWRAGCRTPPPPARQCWDWFQHLQDSVVNLRWGEGKGGPQEMVTSSARCLLKKLSSRLVEDLGGALVASAVGQELRAEV